MRVGEIFEIKIEKIVFGGEGLGYINDMATFVPMSAIGDILKIKIISVKKNYARGLIESIIKPSSDRINSKNISFEDYSGCDFAMLKYDKQIEYKKKILMDIFKNYGDIDVIKSDKEVNYRNKVAEPFVKINGEIFTGFFSKKSHDVFLAKNDNLRSKEASNIIEEFLKMINMHKGTKREFKVYNDINETGFLKTCLVRNNEKGEVMLIIVVNKSSNIKRLEAILKTLFIKNKNLISVYISVKEKKDNIILGENLIHVCGEKYIVEEIMDINFKIYPDSFFQINKNQAIKMYKDAIKLLGDYNDKNVIDAFSGTGTTAMIISKNANKVVGIEMTESSVKSAIHTSTKNKIKNIRFICDKVENAIKNILKEDEFKYILLDPPRKGVDKIVLDEIYKNNIENVVYISCNPTTLYRDVKILEQFGYNLKYIKGYDMFPQTHHIEVVVLLEKNK